MAGITIELSDSSAASAAFATQAATSATNAATSETSAATSAAAAATSASNASTSETNAAADAAAADADATATAADAVSTAADAVAAAASAAAAAQSAADAGLNWRDDVNGGNWQAGENFAVSDGIYNSGNGAYVCTTDHLSAASNEPGVGASWTTFWNLFAADGQGGMAASESSAGIAEIATQAETDAGTDDQRFITPSKLANSQLATDVAALNAAVVMSGTWDASSGSFPGGGSAQAGHSYIVSTGGTVDGVEFNADDRIIATTDNASTTTYAANWHKLDYTDKVTSVAGQTGVITLAGLGLGTGDSPQFAGVNFGHASDTTVTRDSAGKIAVEGVVVPTVSSTETQTNKTFTNVTFDGSITEEEFSIPSSTTPEIDAADGTVQRWTLTGNSTPTDVLNNGESIVLMIDDGTAYTITWTMVDQWIGGSAPTLPTSGYAVIVIWKTNNVVYGSHVGDAS